tara:strand:+ start:853 stop:1092 length:240 start_codon:yes stop_codon:yes gene_type:complete
VKIIQLNFTKKKINNAYIINLITDNENKQTLKLLSEKELRKLSDKELDKYNSKLIKEIVQSFADSLDFYDFEKFDNRRY